MKKSNLKYFLGAFLTLFVATSCEDQLDINENPNSPTKADVNLVLPQAIVSTAATTSSFNNYGAHFGGFMANAGGFSGFGNLLNYNLTPGDWNGMWVQTYQDPLADLKYVMDNTEGSDELAYFNAAARILTVYNYQRLVDAFGNIPYSQALRADEGIVAPAYDDAYTVYQDLLAQLNTAISTIQGAAFPLRLTRASDPLFGSNTTAERPIDEQMADWLRFANTLKLRILMRLSSKADFAGFVSTGFAGLDVAGIGFLRDDAIVDPGYELNRPNPAWATWGRTTAGALANSSRIPTTYSFAFYNGIKLSDAIRGETIYVNYPTTPTNQLGNEDGAPTVVANQVTWASNQGAAGTNPSFVGRGVLKGPGMGQPLMLKAEALFLVAEAQMRGFIGNYDDPASTYVESTAITNFNAGIKSSFAYLFKDENEAMLDTTGRWTAYRNNNNTSRLVRYELATTDAQRQEAIITQKYIALNMINSDEAWNEYRRTGFPVTVPGGAPALDIASNKSNVTNRTDRLPTRVLYPSTEQSYNAANYITVDHTTNTIFWDPN